MKKWLVSFVLAIILFVNFSNHAFAYRGRTDRLGGHFVTSTHKYEFEHYTSLAKRAKTKKEIISLIKSYNSNAYKHVVSLSTIDWNSYTVVYGKRLR